MSIATGNPPSEPSTGPNSNGPGGNGSRVRSSFFSAAPQPEALRALPADFVKRHRVLPLEIGNGSIRVATADPGNARVIDDIRLLSGLEVEATVVISRTVLPGVPSSQ